MRWWNRICARRRTIRWRRFSCRRLNFAFGHKEAPLDLAEKAVTLAPSVAKFHRQLAEALGVKAQRSNLFQQALLARRFKKEIDAALELDPNDVQRSGI